MRYSIVKTIALSAGLALSLGTAAKAAIISGTYAVTGSNFTPGGGSYTSITESFTITFDNAASIGTQTVGISLNPSTITPASPLAFTYNKPADTLIVGGTASTVTTPDPASTDFALIISNASSVTNFGITSLRYSDGGVTYTALTTAKAAPPASVPEPASLAMLGTAAITLGLARRRKSKS